MKNITYHEQKKNENSEKLRELINELPKFTKDFFRGIENITESRTRIAYAIDLRIFFQFIKENNPLYKDVDIKNIPLKVLDEMNASDIEEYMDYLKSYEHEGEKLTNYERGLKRKLSSLRTFYNYYHKNKYINTNPVLQVSMPKIHQKTITRLDEDEVSELLDTVESGGTMTNRQAVFHEKNKVRDLALVTLLLGTGMRVSECVGIDINDLDFKHDRVKITRKGGYEAYVYFGEEVREALLDYLEERKLITGLDEASENALFISSKKKRLSVRMIEVLVKKYASEVTSTKKITPHKLRSTYGTSLYRETGDIYLVADVLGHRDVNTTKKHYAAVEDERRRMAKDKVTLRERNKQNKNR